MKINRSIALLMLITLMFGSLPLKAQTVTPAPTPTPGATTTATATVAPVVYPLTIKHELGETVIAATPRKIAVLDYSFLDALISLQVDPKNIGAALDTTGGDRGAPPYLREYVKDVTSVGSRPQPNFEALAVFKPDLIIADEFAQKDFYPRLAQIAPTIVYNSRLGTFDDLTAQYLEIGRILDKAARAQAQYNDLQTLVEKAKTLSKADAPPIVPVVATAKTVTVHSKTSFVGSLLERLGRKDAVEPKADASQFEVSLEGFITLAPARLVVFTAADEKPVIREWSTNPLWAKLDAAVQGRIYEFDRDLWTRSRGVIALRLIITEAIDSGLLADDAPATAFQFKAQ
jgi:ferric citrate transport system substrate-binding protein